LQLEEPGNGDLCGLRGEKAVEPVYGFKIFLVGFGETCFYREVEKTERYLLKA